MSAPPGPGGFVVRRIRLNEAGALLREALAPLRASPALLAGWFGVVSLPIFLLLDRQISSLFLREAYAAVAYAGYTVALDAARRKEAPQWRHLAAVFGFGEGKLVLLIVSGIVPAAVGLLTLYAGWGGEATSRFLSATAQAQGPDERAMSLVRFASEMLADLPFTFVAPVCALYSWSGSRSMGANLLACVANWRWVLLTSAAFALAAQGLVALAERGPSAEILALSCELALEWFSLAWTLALARRTLPPP
jgi:hypothetical protein